MIYEDKIIKEKKLYGENIEDIEFIDCKFENCVFEDCTLKNCIFNECRFINCSISSIKSESTGIRETEFVSCNIIGINMANFVSEGQIFEPIKSISDCFLKYCTFSGMNFVKYDFSGNIFNECIFDECNIRSGKFNGCNLKSTQYINSNLTKCDFRESTGYEIDINTNMLKDAKFSFPEVVSLLDSLEIKIY